MIGQIKSFFSLFNSILPSILAIVNILFISKTCNTIIAQNSIIIDSIAASKQEVVSKISEIPTDPVITPLEPNILSTITPYIVFIGSFLVFGIVVYVYYTSGSNSSSDCPPSMEVKKLEKEFEETLPEIAEESKGYFIPHESFDNGKEDLLKGMSSLAEQLEKNSKLISTVGNEQLQIKRAIGSLKLSHSHELQAVTEQVDQLTGAIKSLYELIGTYFKVT